LTKPAFKIDENLPRDVGDLLRQHGYDTATVHEQAMVGSPDPHIAQVCKSESRALITLDLDFSNIRTYPPSEHPGIIVVRTPHHDKKTILALVSRVIPLLVKEPLRGALWIAEADRVRIWRSWDS
jgi:predicted nuclease of predicted toxin-antitoxin system